MDRYVTLLLVQKFKWLVVSTCPWVNAFDEVSWAQCLNCCLHGWSQSYSGHGGPPNYFIPITEDAPSPKFPSTWMGCLFCSPRGRAAHTITVTTTPTRKGVCLYLLKWLSTISLRQGQRNGKNPSNKYESSPQKCPGKFGEQTLRCSHFVLLWIGMTELDDLSSKKVATEIFLLFGLLCPIIFKILTEIPNLFSV